ncbi:GNAT family N-acetyltransferase [Actinoplanes sp. NPDC051861]|uniref:GNAT family N-acetyltransferase n=1 Tax=Actinoplanes sp. NPDC051861 TaxID=3155170 RepID=UPI0034280BB6
MSIGDVHVRKATEADQPAVEHILTTSWGGTIVIGHGVEYNAARLPALIAERDGAVAGLLTYHLTDDTLEVVTLDAPARHTGAGTALLTAAIDLARESGLHRLWLITTNDNLDALRFYQRRGLRIVAVTPDALDLVRERKPFVPQEGHYGIPLRDELTLELRL